jgi:predicted deacetylase
VIHVSIHDVSPRWRDEIETALGWCRDVGVRPGLLVVPDFHHRFPLREDAAYCDRVRALARDGHELFLHGYHHLSPSGAGVGHFVAQRVVSAGEAEFAAYDARDGEALLDRGLALFEELGLKASGFIPPAWARRAWLVPALRARGIDYVEDQLFAYRPVRGDRVFAPAINFASRTLGRRVSSVAYARLARSWRRVGFGVRVAIHPADLHHPWLVDETRSLLAWAKGRTTDTVASLF